MIHLVLAAIENNSNLNGMEGSFQSGWNGELIPFRVKWNESIQFQSEWNELSLPAGMEWLLLFPFQTEWNDLIPFQPEWNELFILTGLGIPIQPDWSATLLIILRNMRPGHCAGGGSQIMTPYEWGRGVSRRV